MKNIDVRFKIALMSVDEGLLALPLSITVKEVQAGLPRNNGSKFYASDALAFANAWNEIGRGILYQTIDEIDRLGIATRCYGVASIQEIPVTDTHALGLLVSLNK